MQASAKTRTPTSPISCRQRLRRRKLGSLSDTGLKKPSTLILRKTFMENSSPMKRALTDDPAVNQAAYDGVVQNACFG
jgi:hypothetical protein